MKIVKKGEIAHCGSKILRFTIEGEPVSQARPRFGKGGHVFEPKECTLAKIAIKHIAEQEMKKQNFARAHKSMPIILRMWFFRPIPKSKPIWFKAAAKLGILAPTPKYKDVDNCVKLVSDALNGIAFYDDAQVIEVHAYARYSEIPHTDVEVEGLYVSLGDIKDAVKMIDTEEENDIQEK